MAKSKISCTTVSVQGDKAFKDAIATLARKRGKPIGELVRNALDAAYGQELDELAFLFEDSVTQNEQTQHVKNKAVAV